MTARFTVGDRVQALDLDRVGHVRTPFYVRGKIGEVIQLCGYYLNPEELSIGNSAGPVIPLYRVSFRQTELWPDYVGSPNDKLQIEIYDHWLVRAPAEYHDSSQKKP